MERKPRVAARPTHAHREPQLKDPVVVDGTKYRIRSIDDGLAGLRKSFGGDQTSAAIASLRWDDVAGVWRVAR
jgi:hypothetical protein